MTIDPLTPFDTAMMRRARHVCRLIDGDEALDESTDSAVVWLVTGVALMLGAVTLRTPIEAADLQEILDHGMERLRAADEKGM